jgi:PKD repeat protein
MCLGLNVAFSNSSTGASTNNWSFGDATTSTATSPTKTYATAGNFNVKLVVVTSFGCKDSITKTTIIYAKPIPAFTANNQCYGTAINFNNQSTNNTINVWRFGDGQSSASVSPAYAYVTPGTFTVKLVITSSNSCTDSISKSVTVFPKPTVAFTANPNPICRGGIMTFTNTTTNGSNYSWKFGNGNTSTATSPTNVYTAHGNYTVRLTSTSTNGCRDSIDKTVTVWPRPVASFSVNNGCTGDNLGFVSGSNGAVGHAWSFGDATTSTSLNPSKAYAAAGTYTVNLIVTSTNGCKDTTNSQVISA